MRREPLEEARVAAPLVREALASGELVAPFKRSADPARAYFAIVSKAAAGRPEVAEFVAWLRAEAAAEEPEAKR
ncbi:MAG: hypothetical protein M0015_07610 [Betaproteobacteria bacterium]|nr:hypothetical protein [Betaproteobacteria bacterium]